jgi:uncharacterized Ntn-hydrolase superfamily protein
MTWSIIAADPATGALGIAVATKFFAVGALVPHVRSGVGAVATQALVNPTFGPRGLRLLAEGVPAPVVVDLLVASDDGRDVRQVHVLDGAGRGAAHTGAQCVPWCGHLLGERFSVAGNMLAGAAVIEATAAAYAANMEAPFAERLIRALEAGEAEGGDKRGKQSAALKIHTSEEYPWLDLRVDDHAEPLAELRRLWGEAQRMYLPFGRFLATRADPAGIWDRSAIDAEIARSQAAVDGRRE